MDVIVTRAAKRDVWGRNTWTLADLLGRPVGRIREERGPQFFIDPNERGHSLMPRASPGPHASLEEALTEIEKHTHGVCHCAREET
jgi:hypothetical protein